MIVLVVEFVGVRVVCIVGTPRRSVPLNLAQGIKDEIDFLVRGCRMEGHANPPGLCGEITVIDLVGDSLGGVLVDMQQVMPVRPGTGTPAAHLDPEPVVQELDDKIVMQFFKIE